MDDSEKSLTEMEYERFQEAIGAEADPTMRVLRAHLFSENLIERLLTLSLPRGDKIIENGNLTYHQKLVLLESLDVLADSLVSALRNLNKLRNSCAHELNKRITEGDITRVGSPLGKTFTLFKRQSKLDDDVLLHKIIAYICGCLIGSCHRLEFPEPPTSTPSDEKRLITKHSIGPTRKAAQDG